MEQLFKGSEGHFDAVIDIYPRERSGRKHHPLNGIRWAFAYAEDFVDDTAEGRPLRVSDVWPEFVGEDGKTIPKDVPLKGRLKARMHIVFPKMVDVHMQRLVVGTKFFCVEGARRCAEGVVISIG